ncbi:hypothetical protein NLX86_23935 [Streptomyces sp. A3M-1-3]|uniref:hypothetical protein n=1 Tax=Streptomyces sp. A3M-1-3 TaxID=2962044 RepID=UPI0020B87759|nr:hypothetical protein [Streptomyces sp. A3M-1-3]MCP3821032.1 hypothetical protein [Streptomyces sp. A3M-1-3]
MQEPRIAVLTAATATTLVLAMGVLAVGSGPAAAVDKPTEPEELTLISIPDGMALADRDGNPLYLREADQPDLPGCAGGCARTWPAAIGYPTKAAGITGDTAQTVTDAEGADQPQVIYNTHPLYYHRDDRPGRPTGQDVPGWSLVAADGSALRPAPAGTAAGDAPGGAASQLPTISSTAARGSTTAPPTAPASEPPADSGQTSPPDGALRATPSGAVGGGADHSANGAAIRTGHSTADLTLAIGATTAAAAGTGLWLRAHHRRRAGEHR